MSPLIVGLAITVAAKIVLDAILTSTILSRIQGLEAELKRLKGAPLLPEPRPRRRTLADKIRAVT